MTGKLCIFTNVKWNEVFSGMKYEWDKMLKAMCNEISQKKTNKKKLPTLEIGLLGQTSTLLRQERQAQRTSVPAADMKDPSLCS